MTAALGMAWREPRGAGRHFAYFAACVTVGVAAIVAVASLAASLDRTVARSAKALMGGDAEIRASRPLSTEAQEAVSAAARAGPGGKGGREALAMQHANGATPPHELLDGRAFEPG